MEFLARELNDPDAAPCGKCANCTGERLGAAYPGQLAEEALQFLGRLSLPIERRKQWPAGVHFEGETKSRIEVGFQAREGRVLCKWGDAPFGDLVREGKHAGRFSERLVDAAAELIRARWKPQPKPEWITCVPSRRHADLVPDFSLRLAAKLRLPFVVCIRKARNTAPQKSRQNSFQQVENLENAFEVDTGAVRDAPALLVDDMVDSRWTFAVLAWKLLHGGAGPVFPFALADSSADDGE
jgi:ATP-dependent DNA helicase RecQ